MENFKIKKQLKGKENNGEGGTRRGRQMLARIGFFFSFHR
jgi:hypothetical protein